MAFFHVLLLLVIGGAGQVSAQSWVCSPGVPTVQTVVEVETSRVVSSDLVRIVAEELLNVSMAKQRELLVGYHVNGDSHVFSVESNRLQLQKVQNFLHVEISTCNASWRPPASYQMALSVQGVIGAETMKWSVAVSPPPIDSNLDYYFKLMMNTSVEKILMASHTSSFSTAEIWRIDGETTMLLNNVIMSNTRDEAAYHEMLVHPALFTAASPQKVLIVGGGEGATLREVLRNRHVENATMVDIDEGLVAMCREHLPMMHQGSFSSPKVTFVVEDGIQYLQRVPPGTYDVIIVDGIDVTERYDEDTCVGVGTCKGQENWRQREPSVAYGDALFTAQFYSYAHKALRSTGVLAQYISAVEEEDCEERLSQAGFNDSIMYSVVIDSFAGAGARFALAAKDLEELIDDRVRSALMQSELGLQHLTVKSFHESLSMEQKWRRLGKGGGYSSGGGRSYHGSSRLHGSGGGGSCGKPIYDENGVLIGQEECESGVLIWVIAGVVVLLICFGFCFFISQMDFSDDSTDDSDDVEGYSEGYSADYPPVEKVEVVQKDDSAGPPAVEYVVEAPPETNAPAQALETNPANESNEI